MRIDYGELKRRIRLRELLESLVGQVQRAVEINSAALVNYRLVVRTMGVLEKQRRDFSACMLASMCTVALSAEVVGTYWTSGKRIAVNHFGIQPSR